MKKLLLLFVAVLALTSCDNDANTNYYFDATPTVAADVPSIMDVEDTYKITVDYEQPTTCYSFANIVAENSIEETVDEEGEVTITNIITLTVINKIDVKSADECEVIDEIAERPTHFTPKETGAYVFRFWAGKDEEGEDKFLEYRTQVIE